MSIPAATLLLILQFGLNASSSWLQLRGLRSLAAADVGEKWTAWGVLFLGNIACLGLLLAAAGALGAPGFLAGQALILTGVAVMRRRALAADWSEWRALVRCSGSRLREDPWLAAIAGVVLMLGLLAAAAQPVVYDALTYRMPRVGAWLQAKQILFLNTDDPRLNYMPYLPDLTLAWLMGWFETGYLPAALAQWMGGCLLLLATHGLALEAGLSRRGARLAVWLLFTMANVVDQFTAAHTDLYTAGVCAAGFRLGMGALRRGAAPWLGALVLGMAIGCKGTMFYFLPIVAGWIVLLARTHRLAGKAWLGAVLAGGVAVLVFAAPTYWRNAQHYDSPLGPKQSVQVHHQGAASAAEWWRKGSWNLRSTLAQWFDPNSQPPGLQGAARALGEGLMAGLPERDGFTYENLSRTETLRSLLARENPDADLTSCGLIALAFFLVGWIAAWSWGRTAAAAGMIRAWGTGVVAFFVFFHLMQQWHPYGFRYFILAAPWMAVVGVSWFEGIPGRAMERVIEWGIAAVAVAILWSANFNTHQSGWRAVAHPKHFAGFLAFSGWRDWTEALDGAGPVTVALPANRPLAAFYRRAGDPEVNLDKVPADTWLTAEQWVAARPGWTLLGPARFFGREGRVQARTWLFAGDPNSPYSIVAFRSLKPGEKPAALVYQQRWVGTAGETGHIELLVRSWEPQFRLRLENSGSLPVAFRASTPRGKRSGSVAGGEEMRIELETLDEGVAQVIVQCDRPGLRVHVLP